ncbi:Os04g0533900, partial [Oryza sativa Japonica Group]
QKVILKVSSMSDTKMKQKAMETVADIYGIDSIAADHKDQKMTVIGEVDTVEIAKKLKKFGKVDIISVGPAKEEKKDDKKGDKK